MHSLADSVGDGNCKTGCDSLNCYKHRQLNTTQVSCWNWIHLQGGWHHGLVRPSGATVTSWQRWPMLLCFDCLRTSSVCWRRCCEALKKVARLAVPLSSLFSLLDVCSGSLVTHLPCLSNYTHTTKRCRHEQTQRTRHRSHSGRLSRGADYSCITSLGVTCCRTLFGLGVLTETKPRWKHEGTCCHGVILVTSRKIKKDWATLMWMSLNGHQIPDVDCNLLNDHGDHGNHWYLPQFKF